MVLLFLPLLPSPTLANIYHTPNKPTWLPVALRLGLGMHAVQPSFWERPSQKYIRWAFPYPCPNVHMAGRTLPYPYLSASADLLPRESRGVLVHPNGVCLHNDPQSRVKTAQAKGVGGHGATLTKYLLQVESPGGPIGARLLLTENLL